MKIDCRRLRSQIADRPPPATAPRARLREHATRAGGTGRVARLLGITRSYLDMILAGQRTPGLELACRIRHVTGIEPATWIEGDLVRWRENLISLVVTEPRP